MLRRRDAARASRTQRARRAGGGVHPRSRRAARVQGLPRVSGQHLPVDQRRGGARRSRAHGRCAEGDIVGIDVGVEKDGYYGDAACTFPVGEGERRGAERLLQVTREALMRGVAQAQRGQSRRGHLARDPVARRSARLLGGALAGRARHRPPDARGTAGPELRPAGSGPAAHGRAGAGDRADGERRRAGCGDAAGRLDGGDEGRRA